MKSLDLVNDSCVVDNSVECAPVLLDVVVGSMFEVYVEDFVVVKVESVEVAIMDLSMVVFISWMSVAPEAAWCWSPSSSSHISFLSFGGMYQ